MFKLLRNNKGQGVAVQYLLTFFLVVGFVSAMAVYVRRVVQGRMRDARIYMYQTVKNEVVSNPSYNIVGNLWLGYEPYYATQNATRVVDDRIVERHLPAFGASTGIYQLDLNKTADVRSLSDQAPPRNAD